MEYKLDEQSLRALVRRTLTEAYDNYDDTDYNEEEDDYNEPSGWDNYVSNYGDSSDCPFNRFSEGMETDELMNLLQWCLNFNNDFLYNYQGRWRAANTLGIKCSIMADIANDPCVGATHDMDENFQYDLEKQAEYGEMAVIKVRSNDGDYYILYQD